MLVANRFRRDIPDSSIPQPTSHSELSEFDTSRPGNEDWKRGVRVGDHIVLMSVFLSLEPGASVIRSTSQALVSASRG